MDYRIVVDTGVDLNKSLLESKMVYRIPFILEVNQQSFIDDENLDKDMYLETMENCKFPPKSASPSPYNYMEAFDSSKNNFVLTISSKLSGSHNGAITAKDNFERDNSGAEVHIIDSKSASAGETLVALKLKELAENKTPVNEMVETINEFVKNMKTYFILESFENLVKNGRMNPAIAKVAKLLTIVPICKSNDGDVALAEKVRGYSRAIKRLIEIVAEDEVDFSEKILSISHVKCEGRAIKFKEEILKVANFKEVVIQETSGLCTNYAERGGIVIAY